MGNLREAMHILSSYIDDIYLEGDSEIEWTQNIADANIFLYELCFTLQPGKCQLIPSN